MQMDHVLLVCCFFLNIKYSMAEAGQTLDDSVYENIDDYRNRSAVVFGPSFAGGIISVDCLRCICLFASNCEPVGCRLFRSVQVCGYFQLTNLHWLDCDMEETDWKECANDVTCSSQCVQNYVKRYAPHADCNLNCEGFLREHLGGPNGCNDPNTELYWELLQKVPGCKGVE